MSRELFWSSATTYAAVAPRITLVGEVLGRYLGVTRLSDVYQPHPVLAGVETMRAADGDGPRDAVRHDRTKWNLTLSWLLNANLLVRLTDTGLRAQVTPSVSIDYAFER